MSSTATLESSLVQAIARLAPALERLDAAYRAAVADANGVARSAPAPDRLAPRTRLGAASAWRREYDAVLAAGARPLTPDGRAFEIRIGEAVVRVVRRRGAQDSWAAREASPRPETGPLMGRFPWLRVV
jgi:hypothetical protein